MAYEQYLDIFAFDSIYAPSWRARYVRARINRATDDESCMGPCHAMRLVGRTWVSHIVSDKLYYSSPCHAMHATVAVKRHTQQLAVFPSTVVNGVPRVDEDKDHIPNRPDGPATVSVDIAVTSHIITIYLERQLNQSFSSKKTAG
jgi:hypothetical protein